MNEKKSYFAGYDDMGFFGNGTLSKLKIDFDCLIKDGGVWQGDQTALEEDVVEVFKKLQKMGYSLFLSEVPYNDEILDWLDRTFDYDFTCNDCPTNYADLCDHWTTISRKIESRLCGEGENACNRDIHFDGSWKEVLKVIKKNDVAARTNSASVMYEDTDWNQPKQENGLCDLDGKQCYGGSYIPVENMNEKTTTFLKTIAKPRTKQPIRYNYKNWNERWYIESIFWDVNKGVAAKYGVKIQIEQASLYYRGTWLKIKVKAPYKNWQELGQICKKFCRDYGFDSRKELHVFDGYELPWPEGQKKREEEDDEVDFIFDSMDGE